MDRSRHVGSSIALLVVAAILIVSSGPSSGQLLPFKGPKSVEDALIAQAILRGMALVLLVGAVALPTRTRAGRWLGRVGAAVILMAGVYIVWFIAFIDESSEFRVLTYLYILPIAAAFVGTGLLILNALRTRSA